MSDKGHVPILSAALGVKEAQQGSYVVRCYDCLAPLGPFAATRGEAAKLFAVQGPVRGECTNAYPKPGRGEVTFRKAKGGNFLLDGSPDPEIEEDAFAGEVEEKLREQ